MPSAKIFFIFGTLFIGNLAMAQLQQQQVSVNQASFCAARESALNFLIDEQIKQGNGLYQKGEWTSHVTTGSFAQKIGVLRKGTFEDQNAFTAATVQNILAEIYTKYRPGDPRIPVVLAAARQAFSLYRTDNGSYNFWPANSQGGKNGHLPHHALTHVFNGLVDLPADADDTALVYLSLLDDENILGQWGNSSVKQFSVETLFTPYRDRGFRIPFPSNISRGEIETGAYMTWLQREPVIPILGNLADIMLPQSMGPRVVLGTNNVDCVVNANVLRTLTRYDETDAPGYKNACRLLIKKAKKAQYNTCGYYYPDTYWFHYAVARAYEDGTSCLQEAVDLDLKNLVQTQLPDGHWHNSALKVDEDTMSTALALGALIKTGDNKNPEQLAAVKKGLNYMLSNTRQNALGDEGIKGGVFFSAGVPARSGVVWVSDSFTTALFTQVLFESERWLTDNEKYCGTWSTDDLQNFSPHE